MKRERLTTWSEEEKAFNRRAGAFITAERKRLGLTQMDIAAMLGMSYGSFGNIERGKQSISLFKMTEFIKTCRLHCEITDMIKDSNNE